MDENDSFRMFSPDTMDKVVVIAVLLIAGGLASGCIPVSPPAKTEYHHPCAATVAQYGPGERWAPPLSTRRTKPACVAVAVAVPDHILTMPVEVSE